MINNFHDHVEGFAESHFWNDRRRVTYFWDPGVSTWVSPLFADFLRQWSDTCYAAGHDAISGWPCRPTNRSFKPTSGFLYTAGPSDISETGIGRHLGILSEGRPEESSKVSASAVEDTLHRLNRCSRAGLIVKGINRVEYDVG